MKQPSTNKRTNGFGPCERVVHDILEKIQEGDYAVGQPLPSARKLSENFNVNRSTISRAFSLLEEEGYLRAASNGRRIVASGSQQEAGLLERSVALLAAPPEQWHAGHYEPGWFDFLDRGVLDCVRRSGLHGIYLNPDILEEATVTQLLRNRPQGMVLDEKSSCSPRVLAAARRLREVGVPVVAYGDAPEAAAFDRVVSDHESGAYQLTNWLISTGSERIINLFEKNALERYWAKGRLRGYRRAMQEAGIPALDPVRYPPLSQDPVRETFDENVRVLAGYLLEYFIDGSIDAILCMTDGNVFTAAAACRLARKKPNKDIQIVGYDNYWRDAIQRSHEPVPPAATVDKLNYASGNEMVKLLIERIEGSLPEEPQRRVIEPQLVITEQD